PRALRAAQDQLGDEVFQRATAERVIVCGKAHVEEIRYFLKNGVADARVRERAARDAALLNENPEAFAQFVSRRISMESGLALGIAAAKGLAAGGLVFAAGRLLF